MIRYLWTIIVVGVLLAACNKPSEPSLDKDVLYYKMSREQLAQEYKKQNTPEAKRCFCLRLMDEKIISRDTKKDDLEVIFGIDYREAGSLDDNGERKEAWIFFKKQKDWPSTVSGGWEGWYLNIQYGGNDHRVRTYWLTDISPKDIQSPRVLFFLNSSSAKKP